MQLEHRVCKVRNSRIPESFLGPVNIKTAPEVLSIPPKRCLPKIKEIDDYRQESQDFVILNFSPKLRCSTFYDLLRAKPQRLTEPTDLLGSWVSFWQIQ